MELWGLRCTAGSGARWGPPAPMGAPATAPVPLCLGSSCCSWAGSTSPVYCSASVPSSIRATKVGQTLLWGGWRGGGCTTPERRRRKEEGRRRKIRCLCPKLPTLLQPSLPRQQPTGTSPRSVLFTSSTRISAGKLPPPSPISSLSELGDAPRAGCAGGTSLPPAVLLPARPRPLLALVCWGSKGT